jgi:hypothetical protein
LNGCKAETDLVQKWQEKRHTAYAEAGEKTAADRRAERTNAKEIQLQQWKCGPFGMQ